MSSNQVYCFACKLFQNHRAMISALQSFGFPDWKNISARLSEHEVSKQHTECMQKWRALDMRLAAHTTLDDANQRLILNEKERWRNVLQRIVVIILYLAKHNLAFQGSSDRLFEPHNGNFLGLVESINC